MSKPRGKPDRSAIMDGLRRLAGRAEPAGNVRDHLGYPLPPSRQGRRGLTSFHDPSVIAQLKELAFAEKTTQQKLIAEALNMLFLKYKRPPIA